MPTTEGTKTAGKSGRRKGKGEQRKKTTAQKSLPESPIEEFGSFVEQLSGARSLEKAMTVQSEFVKRAYETSVAESQKICELHNRLARQTLDPFKGLAAKTPAPRDKS